MGKDCLYISVDMTNWEAEMTLMFGLMLLIIMYRK